VPDSDPESPLFENDAMHRETGYLLWDTANNQAYRAIVLPRGVAVLAVATDITVNDDSTELAFIAVAGSSNPREGGISSNPILAGSANTIRFDSTMIIGSDGSSFSYTDTATQLQGDLEVAHTDKNTLKRI
jgi:hypothetical protein